MGEIGPAYRFAHAGYRRAATGNPGSRSSRCNNSHGLCVEPARPTRRPDMIGDRDNLNRPLDGRDDPYDPRETQASRTAFGWGAALLAAILIVGGIMLFSSGDNRTTTASNTSAPNAQSTPSPTVGKTTPPPATTQRDDRPPLR